MNGTMRKRFLALLLAAGLAVPAVPAAAAGQETALEAAEGAQKAAQADVPTLHFDASPQSSTGELLHGSTGFLYGVSEVNVPSADLLRAIAPKILVQKAADGKQHPSGDGYRLTPYLTECGVENIQIYLQDYYLEWPYEYNGIDDYNEKVGNIVSKMVEGKTADELEHYSFVLFNEPDSIWYNGKLTQLCQDWLKVYQTVKGIDPSLKVAGPNFSAYNSSAYRTFFEFCEKNDCLPEYITWHELQKDKLTSIKAHCDEVKGYVDAYYAGSPIEPVLFINETVNFDDVGDPGALVNWISVFEEEGVYASLPYWGLANSLNELAADANKPNGAWWIYKWYAQMTGDKAPLTLENIQAPSAYGRLYGLTSVDDSAGVIYSLFGGQAGQQAVRIENIRSTKTFAGADSAYVKIYSTKYTGHQGFADEIPVEFEGNLAFEGNDLVFGVQDAELADAYYAVVMPSNGKGTMAQDSYEKEKWEQTYEAEDAELIGGAQAYTKTGGGDLARSNRAEVGNMNTETDGVKFTVDVPKAGRYRLNIYYSSQAPQVNPLTLQYVSSGGQNRAIGALSAHSLSIDGNSMEDVVYDSTVKWGYYNYKTVYVELSAGRHEIQLMYKGESQNGKNTNSILCALLDKIDLTYEPEEKAVLKIEPEELAGSQAGYALSQEGTFAGAGSAKGSGAFDFYVCAPREGYYQVGTSGSGNASLLRSRFQYASDAKAESAVGISWQPLLDLALGDANGGMAYLAAGMNHLRLEGDGLSIDQITFTEAPEASAGSISVEAEDCALSGTDAADGYDYLPGSAAVPEVVLSEYASGGAAVEGFRGGRDNALEWTIEVPAAGEYRLSVQYSNDEPAPVMVTQAGANYVHPYNTDLVERYMQIRVNGGTPQTVYCRNTFCWDTYKRVVVDLDLAAGKNTIAFTNDNSYKFSSVQDDFTPRLDKFTLSPSRIAVVAAAPAIRRQPSPAAYALGQAASALEVAAESEGGGVLSYQWYKNSKASKDGAQAVAGATSPTYRPDTSAAGTTYYYCTVTNTKGRASASADSSIVAVKVEKAANRISVAGGTKPLTVTYGKSVRIRATGQGTVTYASSNKKVVKVGRTNGKVSTVGYGKASITVQAAGNSNYAPAKVSISVTVKPKQMKAPALKSGKAGTLSVKWKKDGKADGYQVQYTLSQKFKKGVKTVTVKKAKTTGLSIRKLGAGKTYYARVRAYKGSGKSRTYGAWSKAKKQKVRK